MFDDSIYYNTPVTLRHGLEDCLVYSPAYLTSCPYYIGVHYRWLV